MSTRTIFEINHDMAHKIANDPEGFMRHLQWYLGSASDERASDLERFGFKRAWWGHHSTERKVVTKFTETVL